MKKIFNKFFALSLSFALMIPTASSTYVKEVTADANLSRVYKVMPLGDSITAGWCASESDYQFGGYRIYLQRKLSANGYKDYVDFVGKNSSGPSEMYDFDNNGTNGACISHDFGWADSMQTDIDKNNVLSEYTPDIVLLQIGTNDIIYQSTTTDDLLLSGLMTRLETLVDSVIKGLPSDGVLFLASIPNMSGDSVSSNEDVAKYNSIVKNIVSKKVSEGKNVVFVNVNSVVNTNEFDDDYHPNQKGYENIGNLWYDTLTAYFADPEGYLSKQKSATPSYSAITNPFPVIIPPKDGDTFTYKGFKYKVTSAASKTVMITKATAKTKKKSSVSIPDTVLYKRSNFRVTVLGKNVLKNSKAKKITIGKNLKEIRKGSLANCKKLKKLTIYSSFISVIKKGAGTKTGKKSLKIYVPKIKKETYRKLLKKGTFKKFKLRTNS